MRNHNFVDIDSALLKKRIKDEGATMTDLGHAIDRSTRYVSMCLARGSMYKRDLEDICEILGYDPGNFIVAQQATPEPEAATPGECGTVTIPRDEYDELVAIREKVAALQRFYQREGFVRQATTIDLFDLRRD